MDLLLIGMGGFIGAVARCYLIEQIKKKASITFPLGTLMVNLLGSLFIGILYGSNAYPSFSLFLGAGFIASFTTFSTFIYELLQLKQNHHSGNFLLYLTCSLIGGLALVTLGYMLGQAF